MTHEVKIYNTSKDKGQLIVTIDGKEVANLGSRQPINIEIKEGQDIRLKLVDTSD